VKHGDGLIASCQSWPKAASGKQSSTWLLMFAAATAGLAGAAACGGRNGAVEGWQLRGAMTNTEALRISNEQAVKIKDVRLLSYVASVCRKDTCSHSCVYRGCPVRRAHTNTTCGLHKELAGRSARC
jgi:hypothetical protein